MALKSVVLAPPPGTGPPRRTVVIRPGAPKDKGRLADLLAALFGVLLLLAAIVLVAILPDKEYATPQFRVTFPDVPNEIPSQSFEFTEGAENIHVFSYEQPDNVQSITLIAEFQDDVGHSMPDQFRIELFDAAGNPVGVRKDLLNAPPVDRSDPLNQTGECGYPCFEIDQVSDRTVVAVAEHPAEQIIGGLTHTEVKEQVLARLAPQYRIPTAGVWTVRVTLVNAGDCPSGQDANPLQVLECRQERNDGVDTGNEFTLALFVYSTTAPCVEQLGTQALPSCAPNPPAP